MVTVKELCNFFESQGYKRSFDVVNTISMPEVNWVYTKQHQHGPYARYEFERIDDKIYLVYKIKGMYIKWDLKYLALVKIDEDTPDEIGLGYWYDLGSMKRWIDNKANPGDEPLMNII